MFGIGEGNRDETVIRSAAVGAVYRPVNISDRVKEETVSPLAAVQIESERRRVAEGCGVEGYAVVVVSSNDGNTRDVGKVAEGKDSAPFGIENLYPLDSRLRTFIADGLFDHGDQKVMLLFLGI
ncbi:hypothetical protein LP7551_04933 [Roseibium album]|nr:hypothetical protein LP7551_04933 [Roseibium album]